MRLTLAAQTAPRNHALTEGKSLAPAAVGGTPSALVGTKLPTQLKIGSLNGNASANMRSKNQNADNDRAYYGEQDRTGGDVLRLTDNGMKFLSRCVGQELKGGVDRFRGPNRRADQDDQTPLRRGKTQINAANYGSERGRGMNPSIMLGTQN
jgi:hypothetical protein